MCLMLPTLCGEMALQAAACFKHCVYFSGQLWNIICKFYLNRSYWSREKWTVGQAVCYGQDVCTNFAVRLSAHGQAVLRSLWSFDFFYEVLHRAEASDFPLRCLFAPRRQARLKIYLHPSLRWCLCRPAAATKAFLAQPNWSAPLWFDGRWHLKDRKHHFQTSFSSRISWRWISWICLDTFVEWWSSKGAGRVASLAREVLVIIIFFLFI